MRKKLRRFESLEDRRLLTAVISEILFDPLFGDSDTEQYVELRGPAGTELDEGTFLVVVESERVQNNGEGQIHGIFDLSGLEFGSNGFLVLLQQDSPFSPDPAANSLISTAPGFGGLPGDIYSDSHDLSDRLDFIYASNTFFLFQSDVAPELGDDLDADSDGIIDPDGLITNWNVLDSISTMWGLNDGNAYGQMVFIDTGSFDPEVTTQPEATVVTLDGTGYVARIGSSTGSSAEDWVAGTVKDMNDDELFVRLAGDVHGRPAPIVFHGRELDHVGSENFTAAARFALFEDTDSDGVWDPGETAIEGAQVLADTNGNGVRDSLAFEVEPDDFVEESELNNLTPGVTLSTTVEDNVVIGFDITPVQEFGQPPGQFIFAHANVGFFNDVRRLRADFYRAADSVSIDVIGNSNSTPTYGRLEVFDAAGNSLQMIRTGALGAGARQTLTINRTTDDVAYAIAYSDENYQDSSPFGKLDRLRFTVPEAMAVTDATGQATLNYLDPDQYEFLVTPAGNASYLIDPLFEEVTDRENFDFTVPVRLNQPPELQPTSLTLAEDADAGTLAGQVTANDQAGQTISYSLVAGSDRFQMNASTGEIRLRSNAVLDFETEPEITIEVRAVDNAPQPLSDQRQYVIQVTDANERPILGNYQFPLVENPEPGDPIGTVTGFDPDAGFNGQLGYRLIGTNPAGAFAIDPVSGLLTVANASAFNYEAVTRLTVNVEVYDSGSPSLTDPGTVTVTIQNQNEPPTITTDELVAGELLSGGELVGQIAVSDPDQGESHQFSWADGFTSDVFTIESSTGRVRLAPEAALDFATQDEYFLQVHVRDSGVPVLSDEREIRVRVIDQNNPPVILPADFAVDENAAEGVTVGTVQVSDPDADQTHVFAIVDGEGETRFVIDRDTGEISVAAEAVLDFEQCATWPITVQVWDSGDPFATTSRPFEITVNNVNEPPTLNIDPLQIEENSPAGTVVGQAQGDDPEPEDQLQYRLIEDAEGRFAIDAQTGQISVAEGAELNFEFAAEHALVVEVTDGVTDPVRNTATVNVLNANDAPVVVGEMDPLEALAGYSLQVEIAEGLVEDEDADQSISWVLEAVSGELPDWISFDAEAGQITVFPWNEDVGTMTLLLVATDDGDPALQTSLEVVLNVEENSVPWQNIDNPVDANGDGIVRPVDALVVINYLNRTEQPEVPYLGRSRPGFLDVNGNNKIEPIDALRVINWLNRQGTGGEGEATDRNGSLGSVDEAWKAAGSSALEPDEDRLRRGAAWDAGMLDFLDSIRQRRMR